MSGPPKRLDSISRPASAGASSSGSGKPALKFKPKVVARKSKEERESSKTVHKPGINRKAHNNGPRPKPAGGKRIPRHLQNTTVVSSGPLSSGAVSLGGSVGSSSSRGRSNSPIPDFLQKIKNSKGHKKINEFGSHGDDDDDDDFITDDAARINMSKEYQWDEADTEFFPVRAERIQHYEYGEEPTPDKTIKTEFHRASSVIPSDPNTRENSVKPEGDVKLEPNNDLSEFVNFEELDDENAVKERSKQESETDAINGFQERQESKKLAEDYKSILSYMKKSSLDENVVEDFAKQNESPIQHSSYMFVQLPDILPTFTNPNSLVKPEVKKEDDISSFLDSEHIPDGVVGKLRYHKSGKITMKIGNVIMDVTRGGEAKFIQNVVVVNEEEKKFFNLGCIEEKIIATPKFI